jgi:hypothetical protein
MGKRSPVTESKTDEWTSCSLIGFGERKVLLQKLQMKTLIYESRYQVGTETNEVI